MREASRRAMPGRCHLVPAMLLLVCGALLPGCFLIHGFGEPPRGRDAAVPPPGVRDGGRPPLLDAGPGRDAGPLPSCPPSGFDFACTDTGNGAVPVGVPYELPIALGDLDQCFCGGQLECLTAVTGPGELAIRAFVCVEVICDACFPFIRGACRLPPLSEGRWRVSVNEVPAFELNVSDAVPAEGPVDVCVTPAREGEHCGARWEPREELVGQICMPTNMPSGTPISVAVTDFCLGCGDVVGSCEVVRTADDIRVILCSLPPACDIDCDMECELAESRCVIPPLEAGEYFVHVDGLPDAVSLVVEDGIAPGPGRACLSLPED